MSKPDDRKRDDGAVPSLQRVRIEEAESILHLKEIVDEPVEAEQSQPTALSADELIVQPRQSDSGVDDQDGDEIDGVSADNDLEMLQPGEIVARHYEILSCLGRGGMSAVYKATHVLLDKVVAIKLLLSDRRANSKVISRFRQEAKAVSKLEHPHICKINEFGVDDNGQPYLVMDYIDGMPLSLLIAEAPLSQERSLKIIRQMAEALAHAHSQGIIHRDIKPTNVIVQHVGEPNESVKIVDFGIAKISSTQSQEQSLTQTGEVFGSPLYMSPEQCLGKKVDARTDIYALGCVLYECLCGHPPFRGESHLETLMMHVKGDPPDFPEGRFDSSLKAVILKALAVDPEKRFQSSEAFLEGLSAPHLIPVTASPISPTTRQKIGPRGISLIATLIVVLVLVLAFPIVKASFVPKDFDGLYQYAWDADEQGRIQDAEQAYRRCAQLQPMSAESWWGLGTTLEEQGRFAEAAQALQTASKLDTKSSDIAYALGYVLTADNQLKEGEKAIRRSIELAPKDADGYFALGSNLMKQGRDQEAIAALKKAVELNPNYKDVWSNLHFLYERHGDKAGAKEAQRHLK